ncbi:MAG: PAS domain-containing protein [Phycisphaerales bacterium]|nr:MAG: PAS domain-containing protein [Phycisphaerales bacterium]
MSEKNSTQNQGLAPRRAFVARGDSASILASSLYGVLLAIIVVAGVVWSLGTQRLERARADRDGARRTVSLLTESAVESLSDPTPSSLSSLRSLVVRVVADSGLESCSISLADGTTIASSLPSQISHDSEEKVLAGSWLGSASDEADGASIGFFSVPSSVSISSSTVVPGRGGIRVQAQRSISSSWISSATSAYGTLGGGLAAAAGWAMVSWFYRRRTRALGAIQQALRAMERGCDSASEASISDAFGAEAVAWNRLLTEREELKESMLLSQSDGPTGGKIAASGDLGSACDALWLGLVILDSKLSIKYCNGAAAVLLRTKREEIVGQSMSEIVRDKAVSGMIESIATGKNRQRTSVESRREAFANEAVGRSGGVASAAVLRFTARPLRCDESDSVMVIIEDITQQRIADESRNAFVAQASHELRTPLTSIRLYVETLLESGESDPAVRSKCINVIGTEARRLERIVGDMLSVAEIEAGALKLRVGDVRLDALFEEIQNDYKIAAEDKEITLTFDLPPKYPVLQGDRDKLSLAIHNVIGNAIKYTPVGGKVTVTANETDGRFQVAVSDTGLGIKPEEQELIFEKFYRAKDKRVGTISGSGLGLALARDVVRQHGGDISVKSELDRGSTFTIAVPLPETQGQSMAA